NLAHALKTPLAVLLNEIDKENGPDRDTVLRQVELMRRQVDHYLVRARAAGTGAVLGVRSDLCAVMDDLRRTLTQIHRHRDLAITVNCPPGLSFRGERQDLEEMLGNLMDNACKWAEGRVAVSALAKGRQITVAVEDDGPGLPSALREA